MTTPPTDSLAIITTHLFDLLQTRAEELAVLDVFYGDQLKIPRTPTICVVSSEKARLLAGAPRRIQNDFEVFINIYISKVQDVSDNMREADTLAEAVEAIIHEDITFGGLVYNSLVERNEAGYLTRAGTKFRGNRLTVAATSKTMLPIRPEYNQ